MEKSVIRCYCTIILVSMMLMACGNALSQTDDEHLGLTEYELACMPCHGVDGEGNGPMANQLKVRPSDLTQIAKSNGGIFPTARVFEIIDGRAAVAAHGIRDMPVWGDRYRVLGAPDETQRDVGRRVRAQIKALVRYLQMIQKK